MSGESHAPPETRASQSGVAPDDAIAWKPRPRSPDTGLASRPDEMVSQIANIWFVTENPAICTVSCPSTPAAWPLPYVTLKGVDILLKVEDWVWSKVGTPLQPVIHSESATHRSLFYWVNGDVRSREQIASYADPVSRMTL